MMSARMFLNFLQGEQRQMRRSVDFVAEQGISIMLEEHSRQVMEGLRIPLCHRKSLACFSVSVILCIS